MGVEIGGGGGSGFRPNLGQNKVKSCCVEEALIQALFVSWSFKICRHSTITRQVVNKTDCPPQGSSGPSSRVFISGLAGLPLKANSRPL